MRHWARAAGLALGLALVLLGGLLSQASAVSAAVSGPAGAARAAAGTARLEMTASVSPSPLVIGESATYTVKVRNAGDADATGVTTTLPFTPDGQLTVDSVPAGCTLSGQAVTCTAATIAARHEVTYTIPVTINASDADGVNIVLRGSATADGGLHASTDLITQAYTRVDVEITKTGPATVNPDGTITYTITVKDNGPSDAATVTWHDPTDGNLVTITRYPCGSTGLTVSCSVGTMKPGESKTYTVTATVNSHVPEGTVITNCATVYTGTSPETNPDNNESCVDTTVGPSGGITPKLTVDKTGPATVVEGGTIHYTVTVTNHGPGAADGVVVSDPINVAHDGIKLPAECTLASNIVTCSAGTLAENERKTFHIDVTLASSVEPGTQVLNCASAAPSTVTQPTSGPQSSTAVQRAADGRGTASSCVTTEVKAKSGADVSVTKTGKPATVKPGGTVTYTITATNHGPGTAKDVVVSDSVPATVTVTSLPKDCARSGRQVTCDAGDLTRGEAKQFEITVRVHRDAAGTVIRNCATVRSSTKDKDADNNKSCAKTAVKRPVRPRSRIKVVKSAPATVNPGGTITYTVSVTNRGPHAARHVVLTDPVDRALLTVTTVPGECTVHSGTITCDLGRLKVGESTTLRFEAKVAAGAKPGTEIVNCAAARAVTDRTDGRSCVTTRVVKPSPKPEADVTVVKAGPATVQAGGLITYRVRAVNHGPDAATHVVISDQVDESLVTVAWLPRACWLSGDVIYCSAGTLHPGQSATFYYTLRARDGLAAGTRIENCATAGSTGTALLPAGRTSCTVARVTTQPFVPVTG